MGCIMPPMPNHLSTLKPHHNRVENTLQNNKNHTKQCGKEERSGVGMEQMRRMSLDEDVVVEWIGWLKRDI